MITLRIHAQLSSVRRSFKRYRSFIDWLIDKKHDIKSNIDIATDLFWCNYLKYIILLNDTALYYICLSNFKYIVSVGVVCM